MKWHDRDGISICDGYTIRRGICYWALSHTGSAGDYRIINGYCESRSQAKALAAHDADLQRAQAIV
jgi:hypothetical protein